MKPATDENNKLVALEWFNTLLLANGHLITSTFGNADRGLPAILLA